MNNDIFEKLKAIAVNDIGIDADKIKPESVIIEDLGLHGGHADESGGNFRRHHRRRRRRRDENGRRCGGLHRGSHSLTPYGARRFDGAPVLFPPIFRSRGYFTVTERTVCNAKYHNSPTSYQKLRGHTCGQRYLFRGRAANQNPAERMLSGRVFVCRRSYIPDVLYVGAEWCGRTSEQFFGVYHCRNLWLSKLLPAFRPCAVIRNFTGASASAPEPYRSPQG